MAGSQEPPVASAPDMAKPSDHPNDSSATSTSAQPDGPAEGKRSRHSGHQRGKMGKNRERGRAEWQRSQSNKRDRDDERRQFKRRKLTEDGESANPFTQEEIAAEQKRPKRKVAVMVGYSGTGYKGMQINGEEKTIERDLFHAFIKANAISKANADDPRKSALVRCARTDKGVHAAGNVISLKLIIEDEDVVEKINAALPPQIRIWGIQRTNNSFSCYLTCDSRWYEYLLPSYCLLPPHPQSYIGKATREFAKEKGVEAELDEKMADVKDFWEEVEKNDIKPILDRLDPEIKAQVLERMAHSQFLDEEGQEKKEGQEKEEESAEGKVMEPQTGISSEAFQPQPKKGELGPLDFALRDIKNAYVTAKRRYRISPERLQRLQEVLTKFQGTNNFHNYTVAKKYTDPSAKRHIKSFVVNPKPVIINDTEWLSLKVHGQSFMMHQIRKMVGLASLIVRCGTPIDRVRESYQNQKMAIPKAPSLGLLLERPVFENYNRKATELLDKEPIDFDKYEKEMQAFKDEHIYKQIFAVEERESSFHSFFNQIDQFKANHFLWLTAGGLEAAQISSAKVQEDVDKQLGDEDEDPEGGEG